MRITELLSDLPSRSGSERQLEAYSDSTSKALDTFRKESSDHSRHGNEAAKAASLVQLMRRSSAQKLSLKDSSSGLVCNKLAGLDEVEDEPEYVTTSADRRKTVVIAAALSASDSSSQSDDNIFSEQGPAKKGKQRVQLAARPTRPVVKTTTLKKGNPAHDKNKSNVSPIPATFDSGSRSREDLEKKDGVQPNGKKNVASKSGHSHSRPQRKTVPGGKNETSDASANAGVSDDNVNNEDGALDEEEEWEGQEELERQRQHIFDEQVASFKSGVLRGVQDFKELRSKTVAQLIKNDLKIHAEILNADLYGFGAGDYERDEDLIENLRSTVQPTLSDFQDIISNAIRELRAKQKIENEKAEAMFFKPSSTGTQMKCLSDVTLDKKIQETSQTLPAGLEAWSQSHETFKNKEREYASFLARYRALWIMYNKERADLIKPLPVEQSTTYLPALLEEMQKEREREREEEVKETAPMVKTITKRRGEDDAPLPKGTQVPKMWKDDLSTAKSAYDGGVLCYDDYMEHVQTCLKMAAILQQKSTLLGNTYPEMRLKQALNQRVDDILNEVQVKKKSLGVMVRNLGNKYTEMLFGLDNMEKTIRIEQEQAKIMMMMKRAHTNIRRNMGQCMKLNRMMSLTEEEEEEEEEEAETVGELESKSEMALKKASADETQARERKLTPTKKTSPVRKTSPRSIKPSLSKKNLVTMFEPVVALSVERLPPSPASQDPQESTESLSEPDPAEFIRRVSMTPGNLISNAVMGLDPDSSAPFVDWTDQPPTPSGISIKASGAAMPHLPVVDESLSLESMRTKHPVLPIPDIMPQHRSLLYPKDKGAARPSVISSSQTGLFFASSKGSQKDLGPSTLESRRGSVLPFLTGAGTEGNLAAFIKGSHAPSGAPLRVTAIGLDAVHTVYPDLGNVEQSLQHKHLTRSAKQSVPSALPTALARRESLPKIKHPGMPNLFAADISPIIAHKASLKRPAFVKPQTPTLRAISQERVPPTYGPAYSTGVYAVPRPSPVTADLLSARPLISPDQEWCQSRIDPKHSMASTPRSKSPISSKSLAVSTSPASPLSIATGGRSIYDHSPIPSKFLSPTPPIVANVFRPVSPEVGIRPVQRESGLSLNVELENRGLRAPATSPMFLEEDGYSLSDSLASSRQQIIPTPVSPELRIPEWPSVSPRSRAASPDRSVTRSAGSPTGEQNALLPPRQVIASSPLPKKPSQSPASCALSPQAGEVMILDMTEPPLKWAPLADETFRECMKTYKRVDFPSPPPCTPYAPLPTPRNFRPFDYLDLREYMSTLPQQAGHIPQVERLERPRTYEKLRSLRESAGLSPQPRPPSTPIPCSPRQPAAEVTNVFQWVADSDKKELSSPFPPTTPLVVKQRTVHNAMAKKNVMEKGKNFGFRTPRSPRSHSIDVSSFTVFEEDDAGDDEDEKSQELDTLLPTRYLSKPVQPAQLIPADNISSGLKTPTKKSEGWKTKDPGRLPVLDSLLHCMDVDQTRRRACNALQMVKDRQTYRIPYDPACRQIWNKFLNAPN